MRFYAAADEDHKAQKGNIYENRIRLLMSNSVLFYSLAVLIISCAFAVVFLRNIFHAGLFLLGAFLGVAGIYIALFNYFLAAVQALVYSGAIAVLILFGIMLTQRHYRKEDPSHNAFKWIAFVLSFGIAGFLVDSFRSLKPGSIFPVKHLLYQMGMALMQTYAIPFEVISALLLVALLGAFSLAREKEDL